MLLLRDIPTSDCLEAMRRRYPDMDISSVEATIVLLRTAGDVINRFDRFLTEHGLSHGRFGILMYLNREPDRAVNQTQLADAYGVTKATITGLIDGLDRDGMVERTPDPTDRRASLVRLTPVGLKFLEALVPHHFKRVTALMSRLTVDDRRTLAALMAKVEAGLEHCTELENSGVLCRAPDISCRRPGGA